MTQHNPPLVSNDTAAALLGVKVRQIHILVTTGQLIRPSPGCVTVASAAVYIQRQRDHAAQAAAGSELEAERVLLVRAQRKLVDQRRLRAARTLVEAEMVHQFIAGMIIDARNAFMGAGATLAPLCARAGDQHEIRRIIDAELRGICETLATKGEAGPADALEAEDDDANDDDLAEDETND